MQEAHRPSSETLYGNSACRLLLSSSSLLKFSYDHQGSEGQVVDVAHETRQLMMTIDEAKVFERYVLSCSPSFQISGAARWAAGHLPGHYPKKIQKCSDGLSVLFVPGRHLSEYGDELAGQQQQQQKIALCSGSGWQQT
jgi:hypothetical protein